MKSAPVPENELLRLKHLEELDIMDTLEEQAYDDLTSIAASICGTPIALVSLIDESRQWFKSHYGLAATETPRDVAFCAHAILDDKTFIVEDADKDERFHDNPLVQQDPHVKFYAGVPLTLEKGIRVGTLCVIDHHARSLNANQKNALEALGRQVVGQFQLRLQLKALKALDKAKTEFVGMVTHELRTPLTSILGGLSLLNSGKIPLDSHKSKTLIELSTRNTDRLCKLVNNILDLIKIEAREVEFHFENIDLNDVVEESVTLLESFIIDKCGMRVELELHKDLPKVRADKNWIHQVANNLLSNAAKFAPDGTTVSVSTSLDGAFGVFAVRDEGPGIPEAEHALIFEKFSHPSKLTKGKAPGSGLGLNLVKQIVDAHCGVIDVRSSPGKGATFAVKLPRVT